jgi:hypothetical protein
MLVALVKEGIITRNEARRERGMDRVAGGDVLADEGARGRVPRETTAAPSASAPDRAGSGDPTTDR